MSRAKLMASVLVSIGATALLARAQEAPTEVPLLGRAVFRFGVEPRVITPETFLLNPPFLDELKITPAQRERLEQLKKQNARAREQLQKESNEARRQLGENPDPEAVADFRERYRNAQNALREEAQAIPSKVFDRGQRARMEQIQLQIAGPLAFLSPDIQQRLNLDPDQIDAITALVGQGREAMKQASVVSTQVLPEENLRGANRAALGKSKSFMGEVERRSDAVLKARQETMRAIGKLLTKGQRARYEKMLGEPYDFDKLRTDQKPATADTEPAKK